MQKASAPTEAFVKAASEPPLIAADHSMTFVILVRGSLKRKGAFALFLFRRPFMQNHEIAGPSLAPAKRRNLPNRILRAFDNAKHLEGIARGPRDTLGELCRFVSQDLPYASIFA